ncbi:hypothetical protein [Lactobacillus paraplantarum] [Lactiplantibacillus mudanjiangensis]|uniref:HAD hydrolase family protein n=1 Tax=Lactiplantibacillus mudanjiangensis TaxID=1296538 RepID=UPI0010152D6E|nr:hypothetical protein [Lactobacillus paraplantarum] [Lactiplantibacillus mudanjiangensis]
MHYIFDVDGTISFDVRTIGAAIQAALVVLNQQHPVWFASARPIRDLMPIVPQLDQSVLIGANGAMVSRDQQIQVMAPITTADFEVVKQLILSENLDYVVDGRWDLAVKVTTPNSILHQLDPARQAKRISLAEIDESVKIILLGLSSDQQQKIHRQLSAETELEIVGHAGEGNLDLTARKINKLTTLRQLGVQDYVAFGNDQNDLKMLTQATTSVWINSKPKLAALGSQFDYQCEPADVAAMIQQLSC